MKAPFKIIAIKEFKEVPFFDSSMSESTNYDDHYLEEAIYIASSIADFFSGYQLSKDLDGHEQIAIDDEELDIIYDIPKLDGIKYGVARQVQHSLRKGIEYMRGQSSFSLGSQSYSSSNPDDPLYVVPELLTELQKQGYLQKQFIGSTSATKKGFNYHEETYDGETRPITLRYANAHFINKKNFKSGDDTILFATPDNPYETIMDIRVNKNTLAEIVTDDDNFFEHIMNEILANENFITRLSEILGKNENFVKELIELMYPKIKDSLLNDTDFIDTLKSLIESDEQFINSIADKVNALLLDNETFINKVVDLVKSSILNDDNFLNDLANKMPPLTQEKFDELLANSNFKKTIYREDYDRLGTEVKIPQGIIKNGVMVSVYAPGTLPNEGKYVFTLYVDQEQYEKAATLENRWYFQIPNGTSAKLTLNIENLGSSVFFTFYGDYVYEFVKITIL